MEYVSPESCLLPGYPLQLELVDDVADAPSAGIYTSMVIGLEPDVLHVDIPKVDGQPIILPNGTLMRIISLMEGALYTFESHVTGYVYGIPTALCLAPPQSVLRSQRREFVRVPSDLYGRVGADGEDMGVKLRDISAGGISFFCTKALRGMLDISINLASGAGQDWLSANLLVRRVIPTKTDFIIACSFQNLARKDEERVIAYLYRRQRQLRQLSS
jgi:c-di-GMP-binding flagellar brake protein YcgR